MHHIFGIVLGAVGEVGLVAGFVAFLHPVPVGFVVLAVGGVAVFVEVEVAEDFRAFWNAAERQVVGVRLTEDTGVVQIACGIVMNGVDLPEVRDSREAAAGLLQPIVVQPLPQGDGAVAFDHVTEIQRRLPLPGHGVDDFLIQPTGFFDLCVGVAAKGVFALFGEE